VSQDIHRAIVSANLEVTVVRGDPPVEDFSDFDHPLTNSEAPRGILPGTIRRITLGLSWQKEMPEGI